MPYNQDATNKLKELLEKLISFNEFSAEDISRIIELIDNGANPNIPSEKHRFTILHLAAQNGESDFISSLPQKDQMNLRQKTVNGHTALDLAFINRNSDVARALLVGNFPDIGSIIDTTLLTGETYLSIAITNNDLETVKALLTAGANPNLLNGNKTRPLSIAITNNDLETVKALLTAGANPNLLNGNKTTPLSIAIERYDLIMVQTLLNAGANTNLFIRDRDTALTTAIRMSDAKEVKRHVGTLFGNQEDTTINHIEKFSNLSLKIVQTIIAREFTNVNAFNTKGETPLDIAIGQNNNQIIAALREKGAKTAEELRNTPSNDQQPQSFADRVASTMGTFPGPKR